MMLKCLGSLNLLSFVRFENLEVPSFDQDMGGTQQDPSKVWPADEFATTRIDIRKFLQFLSGQQINPHRVICSKIHLGY